MVLGGLSCRRLGVLRWVAVRAWHPVVGCFALDGFPCFLGVAFWGRWLRLEALDRLRQLCGRRPVLCRVLVVAVPCIAAAFGRQPG